MAAGKGAAGRKSPQKAISRTPATRVRGPLDPADALMMNLPQANLEANILAVVPADKPGRAKHLVCVYK